MSEPLSASAILAEAATLTGTTELTEAAAVGFRELLRAFNTEAHLSPQMRPMVHAQLVGRSPRTRPWRPTAWPTLRSPMSASSGR